MNYLIYTRVSPKGSSWTGGETTVIDQDTQCRAYVLATDPDGTIIGTVQDEFESGGSSKRPGWQKILADVKHGTAEWDVLVVRHLDRFSRSISDAVNALELFHANGKHLIATAQGLNSSTPSGRGVINILLSIAQMEREFTAERTRLKMISIAAKGEWPSGTPPYGYKRGEKKDNKLYVHDERGNNVRQIFLRYKNGTGPRQIARDYGLSINTIYYILKNRIYLGVIPYNGQEYPGKHKALIDKKLFDSCQTRLPVHGPKPRPAAQKYPYLFTGLITCHCGRAMTPVSANGRTKRYHYYQCTDREKCKTRVSAPEIEAEILDTMRAIKLTDQEIEAICEAIRKTIEKRSQDLPQSEAINSALNLAKQKKERLTKMFIDGLISAENADLMNKELSSATQEVSTLTGQLAAIKAATETSPELIEEMCNFARKLGNLEKLIDSAQKHENTDTLAHIARTWIKEIHENNGQWELTLNLPVRLPNLSGDPACAKTNHRILLLKIANTTVYAMAKAA